MKVLIVGSGGREHALAWKIKQSPKVEKIFCAPGNAGMSEIAQCIDIAATDLGKLLEFAKQEKIDLTVVGPEQPLTKGVVDLFRKAGLRIFGPSQDGAALEGSKVFTKQLMEKYNIPSGAYKVFDNRDHAVAYVERIDAPLVIKADGLAAGKGVVIATTRDKAIKAIDQIMADKAFGAAGDRIVIEEFLDGEEASFIAFTDGKTVLPLPSSQDHKAVFDGDKGPNTGGMGAYSPAPVVTGHIHQLAMEKVMIPTVQAMAAEGRPYKGMLYAGLMVKDDNIKVLEFNCRFGDPEAQPLLMRLKSDLVDIMDAVIDERLADISLKIDPRPTVCVVMAAGGYPGSYEKGRIIKGLEDAAEMENVVVFHAGTKSDGENIITNGGRVLGVTAIGDTLQAAIQDAYRAVDLISWKDCFYRKDIGGKALAKRTGGAQVGIIMGSDSDLPIMQECINILKTFHIGYEVTIASAHRTPERAAEFSSTARERGIKVIIAGAGMAAHLAGVLAAHTTLPVIGVPLDASTLNGLDSLLSTVQMPPGIPVATMGIGKAGAKNSAILAAQILSISDHEIADRLSIFKQKMAATVDEKAKKLSL